jgi:phosphoglycerate dehydrogenase-like enzyme
MEIKALFTYDYGKEKMDSIRKLGYDITIIHEKQVEFSEEIKETEVLVCYNPFNTLDISKLNKLKWIQLSSIGIDQLPSAAFKNPCLKVTNNRGGYSIPMGEWIVLNTLQMLKHSKKLFEQQRNKKWKMDTGILEIYKKTIGFIGTGSIAIEAAKRFQGFGVKILGVNTNGRAVQYFDKCYSTQEVDEMLSICDVVVITIPSTKETYRLIDKSRLLAMKDGVFIINVARGNVIDEDELIKNLKTGKIASAALDVFDEEPLEKDSPLWKMDNIIISPHNSWISEMKNERRFEGIYENMKRYADHERLQNVVDLNRGY